ncbi:hypothetical protein Tsubulata_018462 [Turnera subulata]|uniref:F-box domain-containing protein n=1 Tax=Turnera subulata TaxID=218843 RepID=A0A9Q0JCS7_9ROSI|nr:hypothetical protein Tsubulata_018462 [Turnera subulata]
MSGSSRRKRQRTRNQSSTPPPTTTSPSSSSLHRTQPNPPAAEFPLDDFLLAEILCRLPGPKFLFQCTCVCKQWYSLISSPYFARLFINHYMRNKNDDGGHDKEDGGDVGFDGNNVLVSFEKSPVSVIASCGVSALFGDLGDHRTCNNILMDSDEALFDTLDLRFSYLPIRKEPVRVLAVFNDLFLCSVGRTKRYLVNPFTTKWVALPPVPRIHKGTSCGLVCEPHCFKDSKGEYAFDSHFRYRVVLIADALHTRNPSVETYCSETGKWSRTVLEEGVDQGPAIVESNVVAYKGELVWYNGKHVVFLDPFAGKTCFVRRPPDCPPPADYSYHINYSVGLCRGSLRLMKWNFVPLYLPNLTVWQLEDRRRGEWSLKHSVNIFSFVKARNHMTTGLICHPTDPNLVYFVRDNSDVISCDLRAKEWGVAAEMSPKLIFHPSLGAFPFVLPLWPTPIPMPPQDS